MTEHAPTDSFVQRRIEVALDDEDGSIAGGVKTLFLDNGRLADFGEDQLVEFIMEQHTLDKLSATYVMNQHTNRLIQSIARGAQ